MISDIEIHAELTRLLIAVTSTANELYPALRKRPGGHVIAARLKHAATLFELDLVNRLREISAWESPGRCCDCQRVLNVEEDHYHEPNGSVYCLDCGTRAAVEGRLEWYLIPYTLVGQTEMPASSAETSAAATGLLCP
jgi:hypothetical protein